MDPAVPQKLRNLKGVDATLVHFSKLLPAIPACPMSLQVIATWLCITLCVVFSLPFIQSSAFGLIYVLSLHDAFIFVYMHVL